MKKYIPSLLLVVLLTSGCGGGGASKDSGSQSPNNRDTTSIDTNAGQGKTTGVYKLWEYITPKTDKTNNFIETTADKTNSYKTTYALSANSVTETSDYAKNEQTIYSKKDDRITVSFKKDGAPNGSYDLDLTADIGDIVTVKESTCKLFKHYDSIKIGDKSFTDVLEIQCKNQPGYYQKGVGEVAQTQVLGINGARSVRVLSN